MPAGLGEIAGEGDVVGVGLGEATPGIVISEVGRETSEPFSSVSSTTTGGVSAGPRDLFQRYHPPISTAKRTIAPMIKGPKSRQIARESAETRSRSKDLVSSVTVSCRTCSSILFDNARFA